MQVALFIDFGKPPAAPSLSPRCERGRQSFLSGKVGEANITKVFMISCTTVILNAIDKRMIGRTLQDSGINLMELNMSFLYACIYNFLT